MNRMIWLLAAGLAYLTGCNSSPHQMASHPRAVAKAASKPQPAPTPTAKPTFIKLHPQFRFVIKRLRVERSTYEETKEERIFFSVGLGYQGPKPIWWGKRPQLYTLTFITEAGKRYEAANVRQGGDCFGGDGLCVLWTFVSVPRLKKADRVIKAVAVFEIEDTGLAKITVRVPRKSQRN